MMKRLLSLVLTLVMLIGILPMPAYSSEILRSSNAKTGEGLHFPVATSANYIGTYSALDGDNISNANTAYASYGTNIYSYHHGTEYYALDISGTGANAGGLVYAVADGIVVDWRESYGQITLEHKGLTLVDGTTYYSTWYSTYVHMKVDDVIKYLGSNPIGKKVDCGDTIGTVWYTGSSAYHLHFSMTTEINPITGGSFHYRDRRNNAPNDANTILYYARKTLNPEWVFEIMSNKQIQVNWGIADNGRADLEARFKRGTEYAPGNAKNLTLFGGSTNGSTTPSASMSVAEYLSLPGVTVTAMSCSAKTNTNNVQTWKLPWTDSTNSKLKLNTVSGKITIKNKIVNHVGNTWYEYETGTGTRGFIHSGEIKLLPYPVGADAQNPTTDTVKLVVTWKNPSGIKLLKGGFVLKNSSGTTLKTVTEDVPANYQTSLDLPCSYEMKTEYGYALKPNTTYTYTMFVLDSNDEKYEATGTFTTKKIAVTSVAVSPATSSLTVGKTQQLTATVSPSNASNKGVTWKSSNTAVATVSSSGVVTAKGVGTATITTTATDGSGKSGTAKITVSCSHSWKGATCTAPKTCSTCGATEGTANGHTWKAATCTAPKTCSTCGATEGSAKGHTWKATTCTVAKTCTTCGATEGSAKGHSWKAATCTVAKTCTTCGATEGTAKGHSWKEATNTAPKTCTTCGATDTNTTIVASGTFGDNLNWKLDDKGTLTISGQGSALSDVPWYDHRADITTVVIEEGVTNIGNDAFSGCIFLRSIEIPDSVTRIGHTAFGDCVSLTSIKIPDSVTSIRTYAFYQCTSLTSIEIPDGVTNIGEYTFYNCNNLNSIEIPDSVTSIDYKAFADCSNLTEIVIPDSVTNIDAAAFLNCSSLTSISIPKSVTNIGDYAFAGCSYSIDVYYGGTEAEWNALANRPDALYVHYSCDDPQNHWKPNGYDPTCKDKGFTWEECPCDYYVREVVEYPALGHDMGEWETILEPTYFDSGIKTRTCKREGCGHTETEKIPTEPAPTEPVPTEPAPTEPAPSEPKPTEPKPTEPAPTEPVCQHQWQEATCKNPKTCKLCGAKTGKVAAHTYDDILDGTCNFCSVKRENVEIRQVVHMFRMYNPNTGEHFYTGSTVERDNLIGHGWQYEGVGFTFPANMGAPVYRLFHEPTGEHLYTMDKTEKEKLEAEGWNYEGIAFNSAFNTEAVQHRLHNPNATVGAYHFTFSEEEKQNLINAGWEYQGIGWYSCWK